MEGEVKQMQPNELGQNEKRSGFGIVGVDPTEENARARKIYRVRG
jgi:hypothetical protein